MKFTLDWLKDHLDTDASVEKIAEALTMIGLEVEEVEDPAAKLRDFVVAHVISAEKHPNADKLKVCKVDAGTGEIIDVVCGAPNAVSGMKSVFAFPGTFIPGKNTVLQKGVIRGWPSNGMLCSAMELQLGEDHDGIVVLPDDAPVGARYVDYAGLGGAVFNVSLTPNRGDATGVMGVARDLAAFGLGTLRTPALDPVPPEAGPGPISVELRFSEGEPRACRMFAGRLITGVRNGPSPAWLQQRLRAIGLRPISALVDITNYITHDRGRPLHVFDAGRLAGTVHARMARDGESLTALDGKTYALDPTICVIADDNGPLGVGGIIGGEPSGSTEATTSVFVESAWFDPAVIATAGRRLGIVSDARYRFERTVDPESVIPGIELATRLIIHLCGGAAHETVVAGHVASPGTVIDFPVDEVGRLTGLRLSAEEVTRTLQRLGFDIEAGGRHLRVKVPSWRPDVTQKADLVEEVMRMVGIDKVPVEPLVRLASVAPRMLTAMQNRRRIARRLLTARGFNEAVTWSFIPAAQARLFGGGAEELRLENPIASDMTDMRPSLLPGLLAAVRRNLNRGRGFLMLGEVGQIFLGDGPEGQHTYATALRTGEGVRTWQRGTQQASVFDAKADLAALLDALGQDIDRAQLVAEPPDWAHPGRGGRVQLGPRAILGWFGEVHPRVLAAFDLPGPVAAFEADLDALPEPRRRPTRPRAALDLIDLNPLSRDFAFVLDRNVPAASVIKAARSADRTLITDVTVFDVFEGPGVAEGKKSLAIAVTLQPRERTLTDEQIEDISRSVVGAVVKATGGTLRA